MSRSITTVEPCTPCVFCCLRFIFCEYEGKSQTTQNKTTQNKNIHDKSGSLQKQTERRKVLCVARVCRNCVLIHPILQFVQFSAHHNARHALRLLAECVSERLTWVDFFESLRFGMR